MSTTVVFSDEEFAAAEVEHAREVANGIDVPYRFAEFMLDNARQEREGGVKATVDWAVRRHVLETTQIRTGYESVRIRAQPTLKSGIYEDRIGVRPLVIGLKEEIQNRGRTKRIDILKQRMMDNRMARLEEYEIATLKGTLASWSDLVPANGADNSDGGIEAAAPAAQTNTVHTLSKSTYSALPGFNNQFADGDNDASANIQVKTNSVILRARNRVIGKANFRGWCTIEFAENWYRYIQPQEQYRKALSDAGGSGPALEFVFNQVPTCVCNNMPTDGSATTAAPWSYLLIDHEHFFYDAQKGFHGKQIPLQAMWAAQSPVRAAYTIDAGQNVFDYLGTHGVVTKLQSY